MTTAAPPKSVISTFERYLSVWVALCIMVGIALGYALPSLFGAIAFGAAVGLEEKNVPAALSWMPVAAGAMIHPLATPMA